MSRSAASGSLVVALCVVAGATAYGQMSASVSSLRVSPGTIAAAELPPAERFAAALAIERVPAGFVFGAHEPTVGPLRGTRSQDGVAVPLQRAVDRFIATHPDYIVGRSESGLVIQPRAQTICNTALRTAVTGPTITDPVYVAFWRLALLVNPADTPTVAQGVVCGGGDCGSGLAAAHRQRVVVTLHGGTLQDAFSQLAAQAPGLVWTLRESRREPNHPGELPEATCQLGYFDGDRYLQTSYVFAKAPARGGQ